jgi:hypothetical protein
MEPEVSLPRSQEPSTAHYPSHPILYLLRSISVLFTQLRLGLPSGLFVSGFPINNLFAFLLSSFMLHDREVSSSLTWSCKLYLAKSTSYEVPHYTVFSCHFIPLWSKCSPEHPVLNTLSLCTSIHVRDQVSHQLWITGKIIVLYILIFKFLVSRREDRRFWTEWQQALPEFDLLLISSWIRFWFVIVVPKYLNCVAF